MNNYKNETKEVAVALIKHALIDVVKEGQTATLSIDLKPDQVDSAIVGRGDVLIKLMSLMLLEISVGNDNVDPFDILEQVRKKSQLALDMAEKLEGAGVEIKKAFEQAKEGRRTTIKEDNKPKNPKLS